MKRLLSSLFILLMVTISAMGQDRTVTGTVTDKADGTPIPGVTVVVDGVRTGTQTGIDGRYSISVPSGQKTLTFSFVGFFTQKVNVTGNVVNVSLAGDNKLLNEVVVTGYQTITKRDAIGSSATVDGDLVAQKPIASFTQLLQGTAPGLQVTGVSGRPGSNAFIRIRGTGSISAGSEPLIVVDGVQVQTAAYNGLNPDDIEQVTVLKDAAASAIYGSRAANGVLVVTTKSGKKGEPALSYSYQRGYAKSQELQNVELMNSAQKLQYEYEYGLGTIASGTATNASAFQNPYITTEIGSRITAGSLPAGSRLFTLTAAQRQDVWNAVSAKGAGDWRDVLLQTGSSNKHELSLSGADDKFTYYLSGNVNDNEGTEVLSYFNRKGGRLNVSYQAKPWLKVGSNLGVTQSREHQIREPYNTQNPYASTFLYNPYEPVYNTDGTYNITMQGFSALEGSVNNPADLRRVNTFGTFYGEAKFFKHLTLRSQAGLQYNTLKAESYTKPGSNLAVLLGYNQKTDSGNQDFFYVWTNTAAWNQSLGGKHSFNVLVGQEFNKDDIYTYTLAARNFPTPNVTTLENGSVKQDASTTRNEYALISYFGNASYDYAKKYFASFSVRRDGSSRFGKNNKYANFYAVGAAWDIKAENFFKADWMNTLRLSGSYGTTGNNNIGNYNALGTYALNVKYNDLPAASPARLPNPDLTWETKTKRNIGLTTDLFNNRISAAVDFYSDVTKDLLYNVNVSTLTGFTSYQGNVGAMKNQGYEITLSGAVIRKNDMNLSLNFNYSNNDNKITELYSDNVPTTYGRYKVGQPLETYFLVRWAGINPQTGVNNFYNINGTTTDTYSSGQAVLLEGKSPLVKYYGTFGFDFSYKMFDLSARAYYSGGNYILNIQDQVSASEGENYNTNQLVDALDYWKKPGDQVRYARIDDPSQYATYDTDKYLEKGDYISLRDVTLGLTLPTKYTNYIKAKNVRVFAQATNLFMITKFRGTPELGESSRERTDFPGTFNLFGYPPLKAFTFGVNVKF